MKCHPRWAQAPHWGTLRARCECFFSWQLIHNLGLAPDDRGTQLNIPLHTTRRLGDSFSNNQQPSWRAHPQFKKLKNTFWRWVSFEATHLSMVNWPRLIICSSVWEMLASLVLEDTKHSLDLSCCSERMMEYPAIQDLQLHHWVVRTLNRTPSAHHLPRVWSRTSGLSKPQLPVKTSHPWNYSNCKCVTSG